MGSRLSGIHALAARCRKVGWKVTQPPSVSGGYRVVCPDKFVVVIHGSYSDRQAIHNVTKTLNEHGLAEAEAHAQQEHEETKAARLAQGRKDAAAKAAQLERQAALISRAAGPYGGPEEIPLEWFLAEHPAPWMRWAIITPEIAAALLERNTDNRPMRRRTVENYKRAKKWYLTHQGMAMDTRGVLQDGQHRLQACVETKRPIVVAFFVGMPVENFKAIDEGQNRTGADLFGKDGEIDVNLLSTTVRLVAASREPFPRAFLKLKTANETLYDSFKGDPERLRVAVQWGRARAQSSKIVASALASARYLLLEANGQDNDYLEAFFNGLLSGTKGESRVLLDADDPRLQLREHLQRRREQGHRTAAHEQLGLIIWAWNGVVSGRRFRTVRWADFAGDIPAITVCRSSGRGASAPPELLHGEINARYT